MRYDYDVTLLGGGGGDDREGWWFNTLRKLLIPVTLWVVVEPLINN